MRAFRKNLVLFLFIRDNEQNNSTNNYENKRISEEDWFT